MNDPLQPSRESAHDSQEGLTRSNQPVVGTPREIDETQPPPESTEDSPLRDASTLPYHNQRIGRYLIHQPLGKGGMGSVYLAFDTQLHRDVALKVPNFGPNERPDVLERFYREAR